MATITTCDRCGVAGAHAMELGDFVLGSINDIALPDSTDLCEGCSDKLYELIRAWWWEVRNNDA
jgi:hypothetical protein